MVTAGWDGDPVVVEVGYLIDDVDRMRDSLGAMGDRLEELLREVKKANRADVANPAVPDAHHDRIDEVPARRTAEGKPT